MHCTNNNCESKRYKSDGAIVLRFYCIHCFSLQSGFFIVYYLQFVFFNCDLLNKVERIKVCNNIELYV